MKDPKELFSKLQSDGFRPAKGKAVYGVFVRNNSWHSGAPHLLYIGSSKDIEKRRNNLNHPYRIAFDRFVDRVVYFAYFYSEDFREDEKILINHFKPIFNKQHNV